MSNKKDLTRIEDLSEFVHDETDTEENFSEEVPSFEEGELSSSDFTSTFENTEETPATSEEEEPAFGLDSFEGTSTFGSETPESTFDVPDVNFDTPEEEETPAEDAVTEEAIANPVEEVPFIEEEPAPAYVPETVIKAPETFEEVKKFAENTSFTGMSAEGNPSFSVLVRNVRYVEDVNDIILLLKELTLLSDSEEQTRTRLMRGHLLIPRISEYAAIFLAHKLRRFDIDIQVGLSDEIHPPKHHEAPEVGMVSKTNLYQNQHHHFRFDDVRVELSQIIVAATPTLEGHQVVRYLGVASEHKMIEGALVEDETSDEIPRYYHELAQKLKAHALKAHANAVVGLNYQITPLPSEFGTSTQKYRLSCTGNLVWVNKL